MGRFDSAVPPKARASAATADFRASNKTDPQPPAAPSAGGPPTNRGRQPCKRTRKALDDLMKAIKEDELDYSEFFFNVADKKGDWKIGKLQYNLSDDDIMDRCKDCGMKISEPLCLNAK